MANPMEPGTNPGPAAHEDFIRQIRQTFERMPHDIELLLFTQKGKEDVFATACRQVIRAFRELTDRIHLREYDLAHDLATAHHVTVGPTLLIAP